MTESSGDAVAKPATIEVDVVVPELHIEMRNYFSTFMLWASRDFASRATAIEAAHGGGARFDIEHRAFVMSGVMNAAAFMEAMINELFQDAADGHGTSSDGYIAPLSPRTRQLMAEWWIASGEGFERLLDKVQLLLVFGEKEKLDPGAQPYQDAALLMSLRNALSHYRPESVSADVEHRFAKSLRPRIVDNALVAGSKNPWWPDHALGADCVTWASRSALALADTVSDRLGILPNYRRHEHEWIEDV